MNTVRDSNGRTLILILLGLLGLVALVLLACIFWMHWQRFLPETPTEPPTTVTEDTLPPETTEGPTEPTLMPYPLTDLTAAQLRNPLETVGNRVLPGLRLIPYRAVGQPAGMLVAMRLQNVKVGDRCGAALVAFAPECIGRNEGFQALTGGGL